MANNRTEKKNRSGLLGFIYVCILVALASSNYLLLRKICILNVVDYQIPSIFDGIDVIDNDGDNVKKNALTYNTHHKNNTAEQKPSLQKVFLFPQVDLSISGMGEFGHFVRGGIEDSSRLEETLDINETSAFWVIDIYRCSGREILPALKQHWDFLEATQPEGARPWNIYLLDFLDGRYRKSGPLLKEINELFNSTKHVHYVSRQHYRKRNIRHKDDDPDDKIFTDQGRKIVWWPEINYINGNVRVLRYGVRNDLTNVIEKFFQQMKKEALPNMDTIPDTVVELTRPKDVVHFWDPRRNSPGGGHRTFVSTALLNFAKEPSNSNFTIHAHSVGIGSKKGRNEVHDSYAKELMAYRIVVVCQRDGWEGHYRLMEALAGGALVMTDPMHPLPYRIENSKQVIVYNSIAELKSNITYYLNNKEERLKIAKSGYEAAMKYHRPSAWMERLLFGNWTLEHGA